MKMFRSLSILLAGVLIGAPSFSNSSIAVNATEENNVIEIESITISSSSVNLTVGDKYTIEYTVSPSNANTGLNFTSSDESIIKTTNTGAVYAWSAGIATVTVSSKLDDSIYDTIEFTVNATAQEGEALRTNTATYNSSGVTGATPTVNEYYCSGKWTGIASSSTFVLVLKNYYGWAVKSISFEFQYTSSTATSVDFKCFYGTPSGDNDITSPTQLAYWSTSSIKSQTSYVSKSCVMNDSNHVIGDNEWLKITFTHSSQTISIRNIAITYSELDTADRKVRVQLPVSFATLDLNGGPLSQTIKPNLSKVGNADNVYHYYWSDSNVFTATATVSDGITVTAVGVGSAFLTVCYGTHFQRITINVVNTASYSSTSFSGSTAKEFWTYFFNQTCAVCRDVEVSTKGDTTYTDLQTAWSNISSGYSSLSASEKSLVTNDEYDDTRYIYRYVQIINKYQELNDFLNYRGVKRQSSLISSNNSVGPIAVIGLVAVIPFVIVFVSKKKSIKSK